MDRKRPIKTGLYRSGPVFLSSKIKLDRSRSWSFNFGPKNGTRLDLQTLHLQFLLFFSQCFSAFTVLTISLSVFIQILWFLARFEGNLKYYQRQVSTSLWSVLRPRSLSVFCGPGLFRSFNFPVFCGPVLVRSQSFAGPRTGLPNTSGGDQKRWLSSAIRGRVAKVQFSSVLQAFLRTENWTDNLWPELNLNWELNR